MVIGSNQCIGRDSVSRIMPFTRGAQPLACGPNVAYGALCLAHGDSPGVRKFGSGGAVAVLASLPAAKIPSLMEEAGAEYPCTPSLGLGNPPFPPPSWVGARPCPFPWTASSGQHPPPPSLPSQVGAGPCPLTSHGWIGAGPSPFSCVAGLGLGCPSPSAQLDGTPLCLPWALGWVYQPDLAHGGYSACWTKRLSTTALDHLQLPVESHSPALRQAASLALAGARPIRSSRSNHPAVPSLSPFHLTGGQSGEGS